MEELAKNSSGMGLTGYKKTLTKVGVLNIYMEPRSGFEPETSSLPWMRSTN